MTTLTMTMNARIASLQEEFGDSIAALSGHLANDDAPRFFAELDALVQRREFALFGELRKLTHDLQGALKRFRIDSRLVNLAEKEVPDARHRLDHVLKLTDEAAHRTMDLVEQCGPLAESTSQQAAQLVPLWTQFRTRTIDVDAFRDMVAKMDSFLESASVDMDRVRGNLAEVMLAQGYQDLSGQIIRGVMTLVGELEVALGELVRLSKGGADKIRSSLEETRRGYGPVIPGVSHGAAVSDQQDVDALLSGLGM